MPLRFNAKTNCSAIDFASLKGYAVSIAVANWLVEGDRPHCSCLVSIGDTWAHLIETSKFFRIETKHCALWA